MEQHSSSTCIWIIHVSQLIRYSRGCGSYHDFFHRGLLLTSKLLIQWFLVVITSKDFRSSLRNIIRHKWPWIWFPCCNHNSVNSLYITYLRSYTTGATSGSLLGQELPTLLEDPNLSPLACGIRGAQSLVFFVVLCWPFLSHCPLTFGIVKQNKTKQNQSDRSQTSLMGVERHSTGRILSSFDDT